MLSHVSCLTLNKESFDSATQFYKNARHVGLKMQMKKKDSISSELRESLTQ